MPHDADDNDYHDNGDEGSPLASPVGSFHDPASSQFSIGTPMIQEVPWLRQLSCVLQKNFILLSRRPIQVCLMMVSSIGFVLLAALVVSRGEDKKVDFGTVKLNKCGMVDLDSVDINDIEKVPFSYNSVWIMGFPVTLMALGPMFHAIFAFIIVQVEIQTEMLGVLRGLGLRESVFWASWWIPFTATSFVNSLCAAITASAISIHAFQHIYFTGIFGSFFFLNLALVGASFFVAAICGTSRGGSSTWSIIIMLCAQWATYLTMVFKSSWLFSPEDIENSNFTPFGLFWVNKQTTMGGCEMPVISQARGRIYKSPDQQTDFTPEDFFVGCYIAAGYTTAMYNQYKKIGFLILFMFPYVHFNSVWGNFLGYTGMPGRSFGRKHASMTPEELAIAALPVSLNPDYGHDSKMFAQGVTLDIEEFYGDDTTYDKTNCPADTVRDYFCESMTVCPSVIGTVPTVSPSVNTLFGYLFLLSIIYTLMAAYWTQVFPGKNGAPRSFFFFLQPSYWSGAKPLPSDANGKVVEVHDVRKEYGSFQALKGVSMTLAGGEVTALLGHNGAGKTTLSHVLSCETAATGGDVSVFGYSVANDPDAVRQLVAVCKQDDYLYPDLSAKEHLELFAGLRGVSIHEIPVTVQKWLESVDLAIVQNQYSSSFSGGMKRRLSLACSTIGSRPLIILDEPTTGMDPLSRRFVWRHIDEVKEGRVILLTTHAMEEADLLADSVAVMRKGELAAYGTPLELKAQYGSALQLSFLVEPEHISATQREIVRRFKGHGETEIEIGEAGNITVKIHQIKQTDEGQGVDVQVLTDFVSWLGNKEESGVTEWGFSNSSLEEVFLKVTRAEDEEHPDKDELDDFDVCCPGCTRSCILCCLHSSCRCCCCPRRRMRPEVAHGEEAIANVQASGIDPSKITSFKPVLNTWRQALALVYFLFHRNWVGKWGSWVFHLALIGSSFTLAIRATNSFAPIAFLIGPTIFLSLTLITFVSPVYVDRNLGVFFLMRAQGLLKSSYLLGTGLYAFLIQTIYGFVLLTLVYMTGLFRAPVICGVEGISNFCDPKDWGWTRYVDTGYEAYNGPNGEVVYATYSSGGYGNILVAVIAFALTMPGAVFSSSYLPGHKLALVLVSTICLLASITPLINYYVVAPKHQEKCMKDICDYASMNANDMFSNGEAFLNCIGLEASGATGSLCVPKRTSLLPQSGLFQLLSLTLISEITFVSSPSDYLTKTFIPSIKGDVTCYSNKCVFPYARKLYRAHLGIMILGAILLMIIGYVLVSFFSFPSGISRQIRNQISSIYKLIQSRQPWGNSENSVSQAEEQEPFPEVVRESELVSSLVQSVRSPEDRARVLAVEAVQDMDPLASVSMDRGDDFCETGFDLSAVDRDELPQVLAYRLRKVYPSLGGVPPKVALACLDLQVPKGQVLGLLGQNGAGKTTAIKIWAGSHEATSGLALVAGYDVSSEIIEVFERLGNCPQFDIVCPSESVQRHLEFFALLKGLPMTQVKHIAQSIAIAVGLGTPGVYQRQASQLSGGMRRRLSIAISLIGAPSVLLLDEPTTGLDPSTRNSIWNLINSFATQDRALIITTHMMLEADTLCNRIAIMSKGKLKVVGTQQTLKDRFGSGYLLQLNLIKSTPENQEKALAYVRDRIHPDAVLQNRQAKTLRVALPRNVDLPQVFRVLYGKETATEGCINQFLLSQSSLEDVFIALGG